MRNINMARAVAELARNAGHHVTSSWHANPPQVPASHSEKQSVAAEQLEQIKRSDVIVLLDDARPLATAYSEAGAAIALSKKLLWVSTDEVNLWQHLATSRVTSYEQIVAALLQRERD